MDLINKYLETFINYYSKFLIFALPIFIFYYVLFKKRFQPVKIQQKELLKSDLKREIFYSVISISVIALVVYLTLYSPITKYTKIYDDFNKYPIWYYVLCFPISMLIHETYYYWIHRFMHIPIVFKWVHAIHHKSTNPSPWAAYSFNPLEALFEIGILPILAFLIPFHISAISIYLVIQLSFAVYGHSGFDFTPKGFHKHWFGKWINTSLHHNLHHNSKSYKNGKGYSYGFYFTIWDRIMGTMDPLYDEYFTDLDERRILRKRDEN